MTCRLQQTKSCHQRDSRRKVADTGGWDGDGKDSRLFFFFSFSMAQEWHRNLHDGPHAKGRVVPRRGRRGSGQDRTGKPGQDVEWTMKLPQRLKGVKELQLLSARRTNRSRDRQPSDC